MTTPKQAIPSRVHADDFTADARTVLPGQPVTYHQVAPSDAAVIEPGPGWYSIFGGPIPAQPDPSKVVGVFTNGPQPEPDYPAIPEPGFYWAKLQHDDGSWTVVEVTECTKLNGQTLRHVEAIGSDGGGCGPIAEWGPKLEPPR